jgi:hypothetical protein
MSLPAVIAALRRRAIIAQVGGFRPPDDPAASWLGGVKLARTDEEWPVADAEPMQGVLQLRTSDLPWRPPAFGEVELLTLFLADQLPIDEPNGSHWCLRTYATLDGLAPVSQPARERDPLLPKDSLSTFKTFPLLFSEVDDWPSNDDIPHELRAEWKAAFDDDDGNDADRPSPHEGLKVAGWPYCVQGEVSWSDGGTHISDVDFVLQVDSDAKVGLAFGDGGILYLGQRRSTGTWHASWQSY